MSQYITDSRLFWHLLLGQTETFFYNEQSENVFNVMHI
jgi:hypothetical protein